MIMHPPTEVTVRIMILLPLLLAPSGADPEVEEGGGMELRLVGVYIARIWLWT